MNNEDRTKGTFDKISDPKFYLENFTRIRTKAGGKPAKFILKPAQLDLFNTLKESDRVMILKARQMGFCLSPETNILTSDLTWIRIEDVKIGQKIISVDETSKGRGNCRKMKEAIVENKSIVFDNAIRIRMDDGRELIATPQHKFLSKRWRSSTETVWKMVMDMKVGDEIRWITKPWGSQNFEDGWFSGMIDGEGSMSKKSRTGCQVRISQVKGSVFDRLKRYCLENNFNYRVEIDKREPGESSKFGTKDVYKIVVGRMDELFKLIGKTRPSRFINNKWWDGKALPGKCSGIGWSKIVSIKHVGKRKMIDLQTSEKTFIAEGFVSHNSTASTGWFYHNTITNPGTVTALIGYNKELTMELLGKVKLLYKSTPDEIKPTIEYDTKSEISFPKIESKILVLPSSVNVGRGYTLSNVLATELSSWDDADEKMAALEASVPTKGKIIVESTPRGVGNLYHRMWMAQDNGYAKKRYGWWWEYSEEEIAIIEKRLNNPMLFAQEYGLEFLSSGRSVFDPNVLKKQRENILDIGDEVKLDNGKKWKVHEEDKLVIFKPPVPENFYVCGVDVAEGVTGGDYSVATIINRKDGEEVAKFRGHLPPDILAKKLDVWGRKYNNALMIVEVNNHGLTTLNYLKQYMYPSIYFRKDKLDSISPTLTNKIGWKTTKLTRDIMVDELSEAVREDILTIHSRETLDEMSVFVYNDAGNSVPMASFHDDCIFSIGIALQGFKVMYHSKLTQIDETAHLPSTFAY